MDSNGKKRNNNYTEPCTNASPRNPKKSRFSLRTGSNDAHTSKHQENCSFQVGDAVLIKLYDSQNWVKGSVIDFRLNPNIDGQDYPYSIRVSINDDDGGTSIPATWKSTADDIPSTHVHNCVRHYDAKLGCLKSQMHTNIYRTFKQTSGITFSKEQQHNASEFNDTNVYDVEPCLSKDCKQWIDAIKKNTEAKEVVKVVTQREDAAVSDLYAMAFAIGRFVGVELQTLQMDDVANCDKQDNNTILNKIINGASSSSSESAFEKFVSLDCNITKVMLFANMLTRLRKDSNSSDFNPKNPLMDSDRLGLFDAVKSDGNDKRMSKCNSGIMLLHSMQYNKTPPFGAASEATLNGISMILDKKGVSDKLMKSFEKKGYTSGVKHIRETINKCATNLHSHDFRVSWKDGHKPVYLYTGDNADFMTKFHQLSVIPNGDILLDYEKNDTYDFFESHYIKYLPSPQLSLSYKKCILATEHDNKIATKAILNQNMYALKVAFLDFDQQYMKKNSRQTRGSLSKFKEGDSVIFFYHHLSRTGKIKSINDESARVEYKAENGDTELAIIGIDELQFDDDLADQVGGIGSSDGDGDMKDFLENFCDEWVEEHTDYDGERSRFPPSTTLIDDVLTGTSSKHSEAAEQMLESLCSHVKKGHVDKAVLLLMADQEFMPYFYSKLFSMLKSDKADERVPLLLSLAMGHALKGITVSMMTYYHALLDPIFIAQGMKPGSNKYTNIRNGRVIRETVRWYNCTIESLRIAYAKQYLDKVGNTIILISDGSSMYTNDILSATIPNAVNAHDKSIDKELCIDQFGRPHQLQKSKGMIALAEHFQDWMKKNAYGQHEDDITKIVGPSGYYPIDFNDDIQAANACKDCIPPEDVPEEYHYLWKKDGMSYYPDDDEVGLLQRCKDAKIFNKDYSRKREVLAYQYYLFLKHGQLEDESEGRRVAKEFKPGDWDVHLPEGTCLVKVLHYRMLFGPEAYALIAVTRLTRIRLQENTGLQNGGAPGCPHCTARKRKNCVCTHKRGEWIIALKALLLSVFTRNQSNYQRLVLNQLIHIACIMHHTHNGVVTTALRRIFRTWSVSRTGDGFNMEAADLRQEDSIVGTVKHYGGRDTTALSSLRSRVKTASMIICRREEERYSKLKEREEEGKASFNLIGPSTEKAEEETRMYEISVNCWLIKLEEIDAEVQNPFGVKNKIPGADFEYNSSRRLYFKDYDSLMYLQTVINSFLNGYQQAGVEVAMPIRTINVLSRVHREMASMKSLKNRKPTDSQVKSEEAKQKTMLALQTIKKPPHVVTIHPDNTIFKPLDHAGDGKAKFTLELLEFIRNNHAPNTGYLLHKFDSNNSIVPTNEIANSSTTNDTSIISTYANFSPNVSTNIHSCSISNDSSNSSPAATTATRTGCCQIPVHFKRNMNGANQVLQYHKSYTTTPIFILVDLLKDLQCQPRPRKFGYELTVTELARNVICMIESKYFMKDVPMTIIAFVDVETTCSTLRNIQVLKRKKTQSNQCQFNSARMMHRKPSEPLSSFGEYSELMRNGKDFVSYLSIEIVNQMKCKDSTEDEWHPSKMFGNKCNFAFVGGSATCSAVIGPSNNVHLSSNVCISRSELEQVLRLTIPQGEGERMIFSAIYRLLKTTIISCKDSDIGSIDAVYEIRSDDTDCIAGMSMILVNALDKFMKHSSLKSGISIMLQGHNKTASSILAMKNFMNGLGLNLDLSPKGTGWIFIIDLIALYYRLETLSHLDHLRVNCRAIAATSVNYAIMSNDYVSQVEALTYKHFLLALKSNEMKQICNESSMFDDPISISTSPFEGTTESIPTTELNIDFISTTFTIMMMKRKSTASYLKTCLSKDELIKMLMNKKMALYELIRASSILAGEKNPMPDPLSLITRISCANFVFKQWACGIFSDKTDVGDEELKATRWRISCTKSGIPISCTVLYNLIDVARHMRPFLLNRQDLIRNLRDTVYGSIIRGRNSDSETYSFDPIDVILKSLKNGGMYPAEEVSCVSLMKDTEASDVDHLNRLLESLEDETQTYTQQEKNVRIRSVFRDTLIAHTDFNIKGKPLLKNQTAEKISQGGLKNSSQMMTSTHCGFDNLLKEKMNSIFKMIGKDRHHEAYTFLKELVAHVMKHQHGNGDETNKMTESGRSEGIQSLNSSSVEHTFSDMQPTISTDEVYGGQDNTHDDDSTITEISYAETEMDLSKDDETIDVSLML